LVQELNLKYQLGMPFPNFDVVFMNSIAIHVVIKDTKMSACFKDKYGLNFMKFLRCVTGLLLPYKYRYRNKQGRHNIVMEVGPKHGNKFYKQD